MKKLLLILIPGLLFLSACTKNEIKEKNDPLKIALDALYDEYYLYECKDGDYIMEYQVEDDQYTETYKEDSTIIFGFRTVNDETVFQIAAIAENGNITKQKFLSYYGTNIQIEGEEDSFSLSVDEQVYNIEFHKQ